MKRFLTKILLLSIIFFVFDKLFLFVPNLSAKKEVDRRLEMVLNGRMEKDIIILGSSRGARNIIANVIENETHLSCFNLSYPGSNVEFHEFILKTLLKHNSPPKILILAIDEKAELKTDKSLFFRSERLYPLVGYQDIINELIKRGEKPLISKYMVLARLQQSNFDFSKKYFSGLDSITSCGSMPISFQRKNSPFEFKRNQSVYNLINENDTLRQSYSNILKLCKTNNIRLLNVFPPNFKTLDTSFFDRIKQINKGENECYIYNEKNPIYSNSDYYYDGAHLKKEGALIFSKELSGYIIDK